MKEKTLYFLFTRNETGSIEDFLPNIFEDEIEQSKKEIFTPEDNVEILDEDTFRLIYSEEYYKDFNENWSEYISSLLDKLGYENYIHNPDVPDDNYQDTEYYNSDKDVVDVVGFCIITRDKDELHLRLDIESSPIDIAFITQQLIKFTEGMFDVVIEDYIYATVKGEEVLVYYGDEAVTKYFNDKLHKFNLN